MNPNFTQAQASCPSLHLGARLLLLLSLLALLASHHQDHQLAAAAGGQSRPGSRCPPARDLEMDQCAARMGFLGDHAFVAPKNLTQMEPFCGQLRASLQCLQGYARDCLQGFTKQLLQGLLKRGRQQHQLICQDAGARANFVAKMACLTDAKIGQFHACMDASIVRFELIRSAEVRADARLPSLCCSYHLFNLDLDETLARLCASDSSPSSAGAGRPQSGQRRSSAAATNEFIHRIAGGTAGEFYQLICEGHRTLDECRQSDKTRETVKRLEQVSKQAKAGKLRPRNKSLIPPLLDILDSSEQR